MNTNEAIKYLKYQGTIQLNRIEFFKEEDKCGTCREKKKDDSP